MPKRERGDLHVVWLDLANAYGSVPHKLIDFTLKFFHIPTSVTNINAKYFSNLQTCFSLEGFTTGWQQLEGGLDSIAPILFVAVFEIILIGARQVVKRPEITIWQQSYMDDITSIPQTTSCTARLLKCLDELMT